MQAFRLLNVLNMQPLAHLTISLLGPPIFIPFTIPPIALVTCYCLLSAATSYWLFICRHPLTHSSSLL